jgi:hypothetical protein
MRMHSLTKAAVVIAACSMDNSPECRTFLLRRRRTDLEFGWGMYARGSNYVADMNQAYHRWALALCWGCCEGCIGVFKRLPNGCLLHEGLLE